MRTIISTICFLFLTLVITDAQPPASFKYQAVVRDNQGAVLSNQIVGLRISILRNSTTANSVYVETHQIATNQFGIVNIEVGKGTVVSGTFKNIDWGSAAYYIKTELDIAQSGSYEFIGTSQLLSVPYALYAESTGHNTNDHDTVSTNELQTLTLDGFNLSISNGNTITLPPDVDHDSLNEIQEISKTGNTVTLSKNGGSITDSDNQTLSLQGNKLSISNGNILTLSDAIDLDSDPLNELQVLSKSGDTLFLSKGNYIVFDHDADMDSTNELQTLSREGDTLFLSNRNFVVFDHDADLDSTNELQTLSISNDTIFLSNGGFVIVPKDADGDSTNELQILSYANDTITLSKGNKIKLSYSDIVPSGTIIQSNSETPPSGFEFTGQHTQTYGGPCNVEFEAGSFGILNVLELDSLILIFDSYKLIVYNKNKDTIDAYIDYVSGLYYRYSFICDNKAYCLNGSNEIQLFEFIPSYNGFIKKTDVVFNSNTIIRSFNNRIFKIYGSEGGNKSISISEYNITENTWNSLSSIKIYIDYGVADCIGYLDNLLIIGKDKIIYSYNLTSNTWSTIIQMPATLYGQPFVYDDYLYFQNTGNLYKINLKDPNLISLQAEPDLTSYVSNYRAENYFIKFYSNSVHFYDYKQDAWFVRDIGCPARYGIIKDDDSMYIIGSDSKLKISVYTLPQNIYVHSKE